MAPRGFGTMFSMIILGTLARRGGDIRPLVGIGFMLVVLAMWEMSGLNLDSEVRRIVMADWCSRASGTGLVFPGLSAAARARWRNSRWGARRVSTRSRATSAPRSARRT